MELISDCFIYTRTGLKLFDNTLSYFGLSLYKIGILMAKLIGFLWRLDFLFQFSLEFLDEIHSIWSAVKQMDGSSPTQPVVVHCDTGAGRTGVFILCEFILSLIELNQVRKDCVSVCCEKKYTFMHKLQFFTISIFIYQPVVPFVPKRIVTLSLTNTKWIMINWYFSHFLFMLCVR